MWSWKGSGSAGVLHLAEIFAEFNTDRTIHFVLFSGEEQGLYGSQNYVKVAQNSKWNIVSAICMDMIGYSKKYFGVTIGNHDHQINLKNIRGIEQI